jgi:hypothetical protein
VLQEFVEHYNAHRPHRSLVSTRPHAAPPRPTARQSNPFDATGSAACCTSTCTSRDVTGFSAPTGWERGVVGSRRWCLLGCARAE